MVTTVFSRINRDGGIIKLNVTSKITYLLKKSAVL
jgi:hypothetical protein